MRHNNEQKKLEKMVRRSERKPVGEMHLVALFPVKLFFIEPKHSKWSSGSEGRLHIFKKEDEVRSKYLVCCAPTEKEFNSAQMNAFEQPGGLNAVIHSSVAVSYAEDDKKTIVFGKLASFSKTNSKRQAIRTIWSARFDELGHATAFSSDQEYGTGLRRSQRRKRQL